MPIGIFYETDEWSNRYFCEQINRAGVPAELISLQNPVSEQTLLRFDLIVSRLFASAVFRNSAKALAQAPHLFPLLEKHRIPIINSSKAYFFDVSKDLTTKALAEHGIAVPKVYGTFRREALLCNPPALSFPCIVKPDCGGRTTSTYLVHSAKELQKAMQNAADILYIAQEYIRPSFGYLTRIELIGGECRLMVKRSIAENGLSAYHLNCRYARYDDCPLPIQQTAIRALSLLQMETGSMDIIENESGFYIIDVNAVSNVSEDNTEIFQFDLMQETARYIVKRYHELEEQKV